jgi:antitoxin MazE
MYIHYIAQVIPGDSPRRSERNVTMQTAIAKWGNSLAVRLPRYAVEGANLKEGATVDVEVQDGTLVLRPTRKKYKLADLLENHKPDQSHKEVDWGPKQGEEEW